MLLLLCILSLLPALALAQHRYPPPRTVPATVYVAPGGSDGVTCEQATTKATPRATVNGGSACLQPGDTLSIGDGTYDELVFGQYSASLSCAAGDAASQPCAVVPNGLDAARPTRLLAAGTAILSPTRSPVGGGSILTLYDASAYLHVEGLRFVTNDASGSAAGVHFGNAQHVTFTRNEVDNGTVKSSQTSRYHTITHNHIHHAGRGCDQGAHQPGQPLCPHSMYACGQDHLIADNLVEFGSYYNIQVSCEQGGIKNVQILRNTVRYAYAVGIRCGGENCTIGSNLLVGNGTGISMSGSGTVAHNTLDSYNTTQSDPWGIYLTYGNWSTWLVVDNIITRPKSSYYVIGDVSFSTPDTSRVHSNLCDQSGNAGCTLQGSAEAVYTNPAQGDYTLRKARDNPALGTGVPVAAVLTDLRGRPFHASTPSLGAYAIATLEPAPPQPQPPEALTLACSGELGAKGAIALTCVQQTGARR